MSSPNYWCEFCKKFVRDTKLMRQKHESSTFHKSNVEKRIREMSKQRVEKRENEERLLGEIRRMENTAMKKAQSDRSQFKNDTTLFKTSYGSHPIRGQSNQYEPPSVTPVKKVEAIEPQKDETANIGAWETVEEDEMYNSYYRPYEEEKKIEEEEHEEKHEEKKIQNVKKRKQEDILFDDASGEEEVENKKFKQEIKEEEENEPIVSVVWKKKGNLKKGLRVKKK